jgi:hypothetical protein
MKQKTQESYQEWLSTIEAKLASKPDQLAKFKEIVADDEVKTVIASGVMAEKEFYRHKNDLNEREKLIAQTEQTLASDAIRLRSWFDEVEPQVKGAFESEKAARAQAARAAAQLAELGLEVEAVANSKPESGSVVPADHPLWEEVKALRAKATMVDQGIPRVAEQVLQVMTRAQKDGFNFDPSQLISTASQNGVSLDQAYDVITSEQRAAKVAAEVEARISAARKEGEREALSRLSSPDKIGSRVAVSDSFSAGDGAAALTDKHARVDRALSEYLKLDPSVFQGF